MAALFTQQQGEALGAEEVDGDFGDGRLHLGGVKGGVQLEGRDVEVHQPTELMLGFHQSRGQFLAVAVAGVETPLEVADPLDRGVSLAPRLLVIAQRAEQ